MYCSMQSTSNTELAVNSKCGFNQDIHQLPERPTDDTNGGLNRGSATVQPNKLGLCRPLVKHWRVFQSPPCACAWLISAFIYLLEEEIEVLYTM
jgi:hypothetical protein